MLIRDSILGHVMRPGISIYHRGPEYSVRYEINRQGLRDKTVYADSAGVGTLRVLVLGDSFTFGIGNEYDDIWPVLLEEEMRRRGKRVEIVKAGIPAYDTRTESIYLRRIVDKFNPDLVIVAFLPNDLFTNRLDGDLLNSPARHTETLIEQSDHLLSTIHTALLWQRHLLQSDWLYARLYSISARSHYFEPERVNYAYTATQELLRSMRLFCERRGVSLVVLSIPQQFQVLSMANGFNVSHINPESVDRRLQEIARQEGIRLIATLEHLVANYSQHGENLYYRFDGHLNPKGNRVLAHATATQLESVLDEAVYNHSRRRSPTEPGLDK